MHPWS